MNDKLIEILRDLGSLKAGDPYSRDNGLWTIDWVGEPISGICRQAADEIERLQSICGAVTPGQSVADIKQHLRTLKQDKADGSRESSAG